MRRKSPDNDVLPPLPPDRHDPRWVVLARQDLESEYSRLTRDDWRIQGGDLEYWEAFCFSARYLRHRAHRAHRDALRAWFKEVETLTGWDRATVQERLRDVMGNGGIYS